MGGGKRGVGWKRQVGNRKSKSNYIGYSEKKTIGDYKKIYKVTKVSLTVTIKFITYMGMFPKWF